MRIRHIFWVFLACVSLAALTGCPPASQPPASISASNELIRVRIFPSVNRADIGIGGGGGSSSVLASVSGDPAVHELILPASGGVPVLRQGSLWRIGAAQLSGGAITLQAKSGGTFAVNQSPYRGSLRLVPLGDGALFDVVNDVEIDDYLSGVLARELYRDWPLETYKAQAVVARTYALYQSHTDGLSRYWDVWADERSQVYGGVAAETELSRRAATETAGLVLVYGPGEGHIFEAYFSSDNGGVPQSGFDAFGMSDIPPLAAHAGENWGHLSPHYNWGPLTVSKEELTRRIRTWAARKTPVRAIVGLTMVNSVEVAALNPYGRPRTFKVTDANGTIYLLAAEEMRQAFDAGAPAGAGMPSSFCKARAEGNNIVFYDGHGLGHGVGMSQYAAREQAQAGWSYEAIVDFAYPQSRLAKAY